jgi:hypothetical protein
MSKQRTKRTVVNWEATGAFCCFTGGIGAGLLGTTFTAGAWALGAQLHPWMHGLGTALLVVTIPLLIFSGYCLDWMERAQTQTQTIEAHDPGTRQFSVRATRGQQESGAIGSAK